MTLAPSKSGIPGFIFCSLIGLVAINFSNMSGAPVMLVAVILGLFFHPLNAVPALQKGISWCARNLLYIGVALMGLRIDFADLSQAGFAAPALVLCALFAALIFGFIIGKALGEDNSFSVLMSGAVAICGVSAAAAICEVVSPSAAK